MEQSERAKLLRRLVEWRSEAGILTVYVHVDPGDRGRGWRIELRERLHELLEETAPHAERRAFEAAANEVLERFPENGAPPEGRGHVGFIELAEKHPTAVWRSMQIGPRRIEAAVHERPVIRPLVELFAEGPHVGVALISADRIRLLEWSLGAIRELQDWEITLLSRDWRERKAERSMQGPRSWTSSSGRDQFDQRLDANRQRFLREVASLVAQEQSKRAWHHLIAFGAEDLPSDFAEGLGSGAALLHVVRQDLVSSKEGEIAERVEVEIREINTTRATELVGAVEEAIGAEPGTALGPQETLEALGEGRARHLVFDAQRDYEGRPLEADLAYDDGRDGLPVSERLVEMAVATDADVTPVYEEAAAKLESHDGVAALLRY